MFQKSGSSCPSAATIRVRSTSSSRRAARACRSRSRPAAVPAARLGRRRAARVSEHVHARVVSARARRARGPTLVCGQHGRRFDCTGKFVSQQGFGSDLPDFPRACDHLTPLPVATWRRMTLVTCDAGAPAFADVLPRSTRRSRRCRRSPERMQRRDARRRRQLEAARVELPRSVPHRLRPPRAATGSPTRSISAATRPSSTSDSVLQWVYAREAADGFDPALLPERFHDPKGRRVFALWWFVFPNLDAELLSVGPVGERLPADPRRPDRDALRLVPVRARSRQARAARPALAVVAGRRRGRRRARAGQSRPALGVRAARPVRARARARRRTGFTARCRARSRLHCPDGGRRGVPSQASRQIIGSRYNGWLHFATTSIGSLAVIAFAISRVSHPRWWELACVPAFFLIANLGEYFGHRGPMHHRRRYLADHLRAPHAQHHQFYRHDAMAAETPRDFQMVLFPPVMLVFFLGGLAAPIGLLLGLLATPNLGWLFAATGVSYFLTYEWLHWSYHQPDDFVRRPTGARAHVAPPPHGAPRPRADDKGELQHHVPDRGRDFRHQRSRLGPRHTQAERRATAGFVLDPVRPP